MEDYETASEQKVDNSQAIPRRPMPSVSTEVRPYAEKRNAPAAVIASWIALEALSPQTYRKPADLAGEDATRVVYLDKGLP
jgi:hypothetical protein